MEPRRPDDPRPQPAYVRPAPVHRHLLVRLVVTGLVVVLAYDAWTWIDANRGPAGGIAFVFAVLTWAGCAVALVWAWKRHPF